MREGKENVLHTWDLNGRNFNQISHITAKGSHVLVMGKLVSWDCSISSQIGLLPSLSLRCAGSSAIRSKQGQHLGCTVWPERAKGHHVATATCSLLSLERQIPWFCNYAQSYVTLSKMFWKQIQQQRDCWASCAWCDKGHNCGVAEDWGYELSHCWPLTCT